MFRVDVCLKCSFNCFFFIVFLSICLALLDEVERNRSITKGVQQMKLSEQVNEDESVFILFLLYVRLFLFDLLSAH